ncbi:choice-of-anchor A family protein [Dyadobacter psychrotolerans]|uniref:Choice-of-anchor A family protein n=1 Tax=Dyadobacter psychrotolerans TaxID=2541721 RepID=A0A4R5DWC9_9BACT|nr:choice-of-anchor A family protein [Dyadobacter psychrotolerans]TDE15333.1 choice-of-anchor A family protein [Dyadobacter psychrotolerans]
MSLKYSLLFLLACYALSANKVKAQSPTSAAMNFNVFVKGNATLSQHESEGPIAIGGNVTTNQYQISFDSKLGVYKVNDASIALAVRGGVKLNNGSLAINGNNYIKVGQCAPNDASLTNLKVWYKDNNNAASNIRITSSTGGYDSSPNININANVNMFTTNGVVNQVCDNTIFGTASGQIDVDGAFTKLVARSGQLAGMADNLPIRDQNGKIKMSAPMGPYLTPSAIDNNPKIIVDPTKINVLTVSAEVWNSIQNSNIEGIPQGFQAGDKNYTGPFGLIINIINYPAFVASKGNTIRFPQFGGLASSQGSYVVYNFPDATETVTLSGSTEINGTILAPKANLVKEGSNNINGQVIANSLMHNGGEIHFFPLLPSIAEPVVKKISVTAASQCVKSAPYLTYSVTANFSTTGESAKIEWINSAGKVIHENNSQPLSGNILFPGAAVSGEGVGVAWPGWALQGSKWVKVEDMFSSILDPGAKIRVTVTTSETVSITYPAATSTCTAGPISGSLPVTLASFTAEKANCNVQLKWKVADAKDFSHFVVQRSADAKNYTSVSRVNYVEGNKEYSYMDSPFSSENNAPSKFFYYRLQQVDLDQTADYSSVRSVDAGQCDARLSVDFYPNPTQDEINVKSFSPIKAMEIITAEGKRVYQMLPGTSLTDFKVNVQNFAQGLYIVNVVNNEGKHTSKILKK